MSLSDILRFWKDKVLELLTTRKKNLDHLHHRHSSILLLQVTVDAVNFGEVTYIYIYTSQNIDSQCAGGEKKGWYLEGDPSQEAMANVQTCDPSHEN